MGNRARGFLPRPWPAAVSVVVDPADLTTHTSVCDLGQPMGTFFSIGLKTSSTGILRADFPCLLFLPLPLWDFGPHFSHVSSELHCCNGWERWKGHSPLL